MKIKLVTLIMSVCGLLACGSISTNKKGSDGNGGAGGYESLYCIKGVDCLSMCCWANICTDINDTVCLDHNIIPNQCGKCISG